MLITKIHKLQPQKSIIGLTPASIINKVLFLGLFRWVYHQYFRLIRLGFGTIKLFMALIYGAVIYGFLKISLSVCP